MARQRKVWTPGDVSEVIKNIDSTSQKIENFVKVLDFASQAGAPEEMVNSTRGLLELVKADGLSHRNKMILLIVTAIRWKSAAELNSLVELIGVQEIVDAWNSRPSSSDSEAETEEAEAE